MSSPSDQARSGAPGGANAARPRPAVTSAKAKANAGKPARQIRPLACAGQTRTVTWRG
ncbi:hypothetical protein Misp04_39310 [Micromonospora sp. NBRC 101691]|nr:hypothetical protein Misp04_39310 [Micromonospora sp. NBRC 101691]